MTDHQSDRVFQAINGAELADIIANEIKRACLVDAHFRAHLTYPLVSFAANIVVTAYPMDPGEFLLKTKGEFRRASASALAADAKPEVVTLAAELNIDAQNPGGPEMNNGGLTADEARAHAGLPVTAPTTIRIGAGQSTTADVPDPTLAASANTPRPATKPASASTPASVPTPAPAPASKSAPPRNRAGASPNFARSVDLTTHPTEAEGVQSVRVDENMRGGK